MFRTHKKDISLAVDKEKRERGWVTVLHPGWSAPTCGKTQYLHFAIRTTFFSLYFPEHRLHTSLLSGMPQWDRWAVMACTCLSATERKHREKPLDMLLLRFSVCWSKCRVISSVSGSGAVCELMLKVNETDVELVMPLVATTWLWQVYVWRVVFQKLEKQERLD